VPSGPSEKAKAISPPASHRDEAKRQTSSSPHFGRSHKHWLYYNTPYYIDKAWRRRPRVQHTPSWDLAMHRRGQLVRNCHNMLHAWARYVRTIQANAGTVEVPPNHARALVEGVESLSTYSVT